MIFSPGGAHLSGWVPYRDGRPMTPRQQGRATPGPKPRLTRDEIVDEALRVLATDGPEQLSMRRLGARLGLTARALYGYFESKDELESALVARVMPAPPPVDPIGPWADQMRAYLLAVRDAFVGQPGAARLFALRSASGPVMDRAREYLLTLLRLAGLHEDDAIAALGALSRYLMGSVLIEAERRGADSEPVSDRFAHLPATEFPTLTAVGRRYAERNSQDSTHLGLDLMLAALSERDWTDGSGLGGP